MDSVADSQLTSLMRPMGPQTEFVFAPGRAHIIAFALGSTNNRIKTTDLMPI